MVVNQSPLRTRGLFFSLAFDSHKCTEPDKFPVLLHLRATWYFVNQPSNRRTMLLGNDNCLAMYVINCWRNECHKSQSNNSTYNSHQGIIIYGPLSANFDTLLACHMLVRPLFFIFIFLFYFLTLNYILTCVQFFFLNCVSDKKVSDA